MPSEPSSSPEPAEPRFFPLWWWVIAAFLVLVAVWVIAFAAAGATKIEVIEIERPASSAGEPTAPKRDPDPSPPPG
jgi:hypothetical protein